ncbi:Vacuolar protein sorting-associated protein 9a [Thalictrum thalictroides]|uniref:Vacuolar protein sorting-associated protein 9a n=1 Tax=Thalictrum thalictroides TaxID=46969 RepID=A0A7J6XCZ8_THATH|nr:Vacuolar protein sorting-associated protein 9a [Thalictrum thalictroides]
MVSILNNPPDPEKDSAAFQEFLAKMEGAFRAHSLWAGCSEEELESAGEGLEKYVMVKLFPRVFASHPEDVERDDKLFEKMTLVQQFIRPEMLDIQPAFQNESSWLLAQEELQKINMVKAPREKLLCILNCCKVINNLLLNASIASNEHPPGADEFLPVLIYVTLKANPPQLHSNLLYIQRYRCQSRLVSEAAYFFTNMLSAESFISNIDAKSLSMDETEFEENMDSARTLLSGLATSPEGEGTPSDIDRDGYGYASRTESTKTKSQLNEKNKRNSWSFLKGHPPQASLKKAEVEPDINHQASITENPSISDLEKKGAIEILKEEEINRAFHGYPYLYAQAGDLTVNDVEDLLNNYKQLVFKYVCLSKGMSIVGPPSLPLPISQTQTPKDVATWKESEDSLMVETNINNADIEIFPNKDSVQKTENSESKVAEEDESVTPQGKEKDEILQ